MADPYDYFCKSDTPEDIKDALLGGNQDKLRAWCKQNPGRLLLALECIHPHHQVYRDIVQQALTEHRRNEDSTASGRQHKENLAAARHANILSRWALAIAIIALLITMFQFVMQFVDRPGYLVAPPTPTAHSTP